MDPNTIFYLGTERTAMNSLVPFFPVPQGRIGLIHALSFQIMGTSFFCRYLLRCVKGPRRPCYNPICFFFIFLKIMSFPQQLYCFQHNSGLRNTPYGKRHASRTERAYRKLNIFFVLPVYHSKARLVVFASRKAIPEFWSFCSP